MATVANNEGSTNAAVPGSSCHGDEGRNGYKIERLDDTARGGRIPTTYAHCCDGIHIKISSLGAVVIEDVLENVAADANGCTVCELVVGIVRSRN